MSRLTLAGALGAGAAAMYLLDSERGRRRRSLLRDQALRATHLVADSADATLRDTRNRLSGLPHKVRARLERRLVPDEILVERVRESLGGAVARPGAIEVSAQDGSVTLGGPILSSEVSELLSRVWKVQGVRNVENRLQVHEQQGNIPALQGAPARASTGQSLAFWPPATRLAVGAAGGALLAAGAVRGSLLGAGAGLVGLGLLARAAMNIEFNRLTGIGGRRAIDVQKTITINAPVDEVFDFWTDVENFPRFMTHVREVKKVSSGRSRWTVTGPAGVPVQWEAVITQFIPDQLLAWKTVPGSTIAHSGLVHFTPAADGATTVDVKLAYNPAAGAVGHAVASLLGTDPKRQMDDDLMRMKAYLETGLPPGDAAAAQGNGEGLVE